MREILRVVGITVLALGVGALWGINGYRAWVMRPTKPFAASVTIPTAATAAVPPAECRDDCAKSPAPWETLKAGDPEFLGTIFPSAVAIRGYGPSVDSLLELRGSGVVVAPNIVVTATHAVLGAARISVAPCEFLDLRGPSHIVDCASDFSTEALDWSDGTDIALLRLPISDETRFVPAVIGDANELELGDWLWRIGQDPTALACGPLISRSEHELHVLMPTQPGASGGPLFDRFGRLVGIVVRYTSEGLVAVAVPVTAVEEMLRKPTVELPTP